MSDNWHKIWENRKADHNEINSQNEERLFLEMKRINGNDITEDISYQDYIDHYRNLKKHLRLSPEHTPNASVFEVGCGCGANLYLFQKDGILVGGIDYSSAQIDMMKDFLPSDKIIERILGEASEMPTDIKYDAVFCYGVCQYFPNLEYAQKVLEKMAEKSKHTFAMMCVHDEEKEEEFLANRRSIDPNYDEHYKGLPKLFYPKELFYNFAKSHNFNLKIETLHLNGFWNESYVFDCFFYKD